MHDWLVNAMTIGNPEFLHALALFEGVDFLDAVKVKGHRDGA